VKVREATEGAIQEDRDDRKGMWILV
jgi:hypothetical protein